ncbi:alanine dehydrogenase [Desulfofustis limnaeus]|uniref:Alanine dehydrogenase n=1 Tax=Desulfofustis limnaeus TaxID=2740163 RepID=A0ABM7WCI8_9BACT|nr:alanine dehydrogenase [Desulfofustis limnaeus]MDX9894953.1 alanine dehydrogenase [Desulfofustis sp.]BDD88675.1 alanine dehydrogenase [Desulfofustis limnaeus]
MKIGVLKEVKVMENRVCMIPTGVATMVANRHQVLVETGAGAGAGFADDEYRAAGATIVETPGEVYGACDMIMHVKEPQPSEYESIRENQIVFTYLHLAADERQTRALITARSVNIAYETIEKKNGSLPLLVPMSEVAGRMATQVGARCLEMPQGGRGVLLGGVKGVAPATVVVIGGGVVGYNAAKMACGLGALVYILDTNLERLAYLDDIMPANCLPVMSNPALLREYVTKADLVIGAVLIPGAKAPKLITRDMLPAMKDGSVIVDVAIDQGGCAETSKPTTHADPTFVVDGVVHYCVTNMPGAVARTSTIALTNATLPYALEIANKGWKKAMQENEEIKKGANVIHGAVTYQAVAEAFELAYTPVDSFL